MRFLVFVLFLVAAPRLAFAFQFEDSAGGFAMKLEAEPGETLCVAWPKGHVDPVACAGFDVAAFEKIGSMKKGPITPVAVGALRRGERLMLVMVQRDDGHDFDVDDADEYLKGVEKGITERTGGKVAKSAHRVVRIAKRDAVELEATLDLPAGSALAPLFGLHKHYALPAGRISYTVTFSSGRDDRAWVDAVSSRVLDTVDADAPKKSSSRRDDDDDDKPRRKSKLTPFEQGEIVGRILGTVGIVALLVWLVVRLTRKKPPPNYPPQVPWQGHPPYPPQYPQYPPHQQYPPHPQYPAQHPYGPAPGQSASYPPPPPPTGRGPDQGGQGG